VIHLTAWKKTRIEASFDRIDDDAKSGLQDDKIMEETPDDICLKERVEDSFESMEVERVKDSFDNIQLYLFNIKMMHKQLLNQY